MIPNSREKEGEGGLKRKERKNMRCRAEHVLLLEITRKKKKEGRKRACANDHGTQSTGMRSYERKKDGALRHA